MSASWPMILSLSHWVAAAIAACGDWVSIVFIFKAACVARESLIVDVD